MKNSVLLLLAAVGIAFSACGGKVDERLNKEYVLGVSATDPETTDEFRKLIKEFNDLAGIEALRFTEDYTVADSLILLTKDLQATDGKVGWGQWVTQSKDANVLSGAKFKVERTIDYAMRLEFDENYILSRRNAASGSPEHYELQKLFFHEVGHGLQMPHHPTKTDVMYYEISGPKDFDLYFNEVGIFFGQK
jgi:hypothetical protein